jgi:hypothetical protein
VVPSPSSCSLSHRERERCYSFTLSRTPHETCSIHTYILRKHPNTNKHVHTHKYAVRGSNPRSLTTRVCNTLRQIGRQTYKYLPYANICQYCVIVNIPSPTNTRVLRTPKGSRRILSLTPHTFHRRLASYYEYSF